VRWKEYRITGIKGADITSYITNGGTQFPQSLCSRQISFSIKRICASDRPAGTYRRRSISRYSLSLFPRGGSLLQSFRSFGASNALLRAKSRVARTRASRDSARDVASKTAELSQFVVAFLKNSSRDAFLARERIRGDNESGVSVRQSLRNLSGRYLDIIGGDT